jgi:hypothetical protein
MIASNGLFQFVVNLPTGSILNTMSYGQLLTFSGFEIILEMSIASKYNRIVITHIILDLLFYTRYDRPSFLCAQRTGNEIILHINYNKNLHMLLLSSAHKYSDKKINSDDYCTNPSE